MRKNKNWEELFRQHDAYEAWLSRNLYFLDGAPLFLGDEFNTYHFDWEGAFRNGTLDRHLSIALIDANATEYACCSPAIHLFYQELHEYRPDWIVERIFAPFSADNIRSMKENGIRFSSAEGHMPTAAFDILCFSQQIIGDEVNLIGMLLEAGIPLDSRQRTASDPIIIRGGAGSFNPSTIMDTCDLFFIGEGEDILPELLSFLEQGIREERDREEILLEAVQTWDCLWAPRFYEQRFSPDGTLTGMIPLRSDVPERIRFAYVRDMDLCFICTKKIGNYYYPSEIASGIEVTKGCEGQCSFCYSGFTYLPFRARSVDRVIRAVKELIFYSGSNYVTLNSFCGASYPFLNTLIRRYEKEIPVPMEMMSQRIDSFQLNPEFTAYLSGQGVDRVVFGVEGMSQRLRRSVSKNYTEEQILQTIRMVCRNRYETVKLMFIAGLPGEGEADRRELMELTKKIMAIAREEEENGFPIPYFLYTWTPIQVFPMTPYQWLPISKECARMPEETLQELEALGVHVSRKEANGYAREHRLIQLLCRGDRRLQDMLIEMAKAGHFRHGGFTDEAMFFADRWIAEHDVPEYDTWFKEKKEDTVFPWDFIDNGVSRDHLWKRYCSAVSASPKDFSRCLDRCQNCGACSADHRKEMQRYREERKKDSQIILSDLLPESGKKSSVISYAVLAFSFEDKYSVIRRHYWEQELLRSLNLAGISYDCNTVRIKKPFVEPHDWAIGENGAVVGLKEPISDEDLIRRLNAHTVHMKIDGVIQTEQQPEVRSIGYRIPCPQLDGAQEAEVRSRIQKILDSEEYLLEYRLNRFTLVKKADVRERIFSISLEDHYLHMHLDSILAPYSLYQHLLGIGWEEAGKHRALRTFMEFEAGERVFRI